MNIREYFRKLLILATLALGVFPVAPMLFDNMCQNLLPWSHLFSLVYFLVAALAILIPGKWRLASGILVVAAGTVLCFWFRPELGFGPLLFATLFHGVLLLLSLPVGGWQQGRELPTLVNGILLVLGLLGQVVLYADSIREAPVLELYRPLIQGCLLAFLLLLALGMNRKSMILASGEKRQVSPAIRRKNFLMTLVLFVLAVGASFIPYIYDWIRQLLAWVVESIGKFIAFLFAQEEVKGNASGDAGAMEGAPAYTDTEPSVLLQILEFLLRAFAIVVVVAVLAFSLYKLGVLLVRLVKRLWHMLEKYAAAASEDYVDEITDTRETGEDTRIRRSRGGNPGRWKGGSPEAHVRYRFGRLLWKHREWSPGTTAREKLPAQAAEIYERARYSSHPVTEEEAENFRREVRDL